MHTKPGRKDNHPLMNEAGVNGKTVKQRLRVGLNVTNTIAYVSPKGNVVYVPNRQRRRELQFQKKRGNNRASTEGRVQQYAPIDRIKQHLKRITHMI